MMEIFFHALLWLAVATWIAVGLLPKYTRGASRLKLLLGGLGIGAVAWYAASFAVEALATDAIRCMGRRCSAAYFLRERAPGAFWLSYALWFSASALMAGVALNALLRAFGVVRADAER